ncbi:hypothetical protein [Stenotrophomonas humi]
MRAALIALLVLIAGCTQPRSEQLIHVSEFRNYGSTPLQHTFYIGSDVAHHHFIWSNGKQGGTWLIRKSEMPIVNEQPFNPQVGRAGRSAFRSTDGTWRVL